MLSRESILVRFSVAFFFYFYQSNGCLSSLPSTAASVLDRLSPESKACFEETCKKGEVRLIHVLMDVMGEEDAGKTCLGDSFLDKPYVENQPSTKGVKMKTMVRKVVGHNAEWKEVSERERMAVLGRLFAKECVLRRQTMIAAGATAGAALHPPAVPAATAQRPMPAHNKKRPQRGFLQKVIRHFRPSQFRQSIGGDKKPVELSGLSDDISSSTTGFEEFKAAQELNEELADAMLLMEGSAEEMRKCEEIVILTMMDRGGQDQYLSVHAALMADNAYNASVCLLVIDGTKALDESVTLSEFRLPAGSTIKQKRDVASTRADVVRHWATAVDVSRPYDVDVPSVFIGHKYVKKPPATFMIATRKDATKGEGDFVDKQERFLQPNRSLAITL